jgi:HSP20 family molecular chaperone IbpA
LSEEFRDIFDDMDKFYQKFTKRMFKEMEQIDQAIRSGKLLGNWDIKPIEEPGVKGFIARGHFQFGKPQSPQPLRPLKPFKLPEKTSDEVREPLTDVFEEKDHVKLYVELPGVEKSDMQLNVSEGQVEVKAKKFYKIIDLPTKDIEAEKAVANYKNGVLEVTIPRKKKPAEEKPKHTIKIE